MLALPTLVSGLILASGTYADFGPKRGVSYNDPSLIVNFGAAGSKVTWCFNWDSESQDVPTNLEYVPMLWSGDPAHTKPWFTHAAAAISSGKAKSLLAFNEPNNPHQANMDPVTAAAIYDLYMSPHQATAEVGAPAVSNFYDGLGWLTRFLDECAQLGCAVDFVPIHWYGSAADAAGFYSYVDEARIAASGRQLWITEVSHRVLPRIFGGGIHWLMRVKFNASGTEDEQLGFLREVLPWLDSQVYIRRYCWFGAFPRSLVTSDGLLSLTGNAYTFM